MEPSTFTSAATRAPCLAGGPHRVDHVDGLAALRERHDERLGPGEPAQVRELRGAGEREPASGQPGREVLGGQGGVTGGATADDVPGLFAAAGKVVATLASLDTDRVWSR